ncbi:zinc-ribbon domain-containing protein [Thalassococcus sp. BH17M4-6]|uniref:zinc-ribbon domain-containing protein n=1 Tax=Thalassococcus sp. BH17M4-6 TaxID=3413148 RepID=UPI003BBC4B38
MRLICPNCSAQYEVPTDVIPDGGRDVQCSNCGHTWFQNHPDDDPVLAEELNQPVPDAEWQPDADDQADDGKDSATDETPPEDEISDPEEPPRRRELDPEVTSVLREEAELESRARAAEAENLESQPDLGLEEPREDESARRAREARDRMARMRGDTPPGETAPQAAAAAAAAASSRRELLPDIDEINQTLRSSSERRAVETPQGRAPIEETGGGFGKGFMTVLIIAVIAAALYLFAPRLAAAVPALEPMLSGYVGAVDSARLWLDSQVTALLTSLDGMSSEQAPPTEEN